MQGLGNKVAGMWGRDADFWSSATVRNQ